MLRRAAAILHFSQPRRDAAPRCPDGRPRRTGIDSQVIGELAALTGPSDDRPGFTYSDLTQRLIPTAILAAFPPEFRSL